MKLKYLACVIFPFILAACQSHDIQNASHSTVFVSQQPNTEKTLTSYYWSTTTANAPQPLVLTFLDHHQLSISTSCNTLSSSWKINNNQIITGNMIASMMACDDVATKQENFASSLFNTHKTPFILNLNDVQNPTLAIVTANGEKVVFTGKMTPEAKYQTQAETIFLEISPETKQCSGVTQQTCLQVKEIKYAENGLRTHIDKDWSLFYNTIEGYVHNVKERQVVRIKRYEIKKPAADQSKYAYVQDMIIEREAIKGTL